MLIGEVGYLQFKTQEEMHIHFLQPFDYEINIGRAYNRAIATIADEDFVAITDQDTLKFEGFAQQLRLILEQHQDKWNGLFTCRTNRLRLPNPQVVKSLYDEDSISEHAKYAKYAYQTFESELQMIDEAAGVLLCARAAQLRRIGGFNEGSIIFDRQLSRKFKHAGNSVYLMKGLYLFHLYRWGREEPQNHIEHLIKK